jgi:hypothetical protein
MSSGATMTITLSLETHGDSFNGTQAIMSTDGCALTRGRHPGRLLRTGVQIGRRAFGSLVSSVTSQVPRFSPGAPVRRLARSSVKSSVKAR